MSTHADPLGRVAALREAGWAVPDYVLHGPVEAVRPGGPLPLGLYADPAGRDHPLHTKAACWVAAASLAAGPQDTRTSRLKAAAEAALAQYGEPAPTPPPPAKVAEVDPDDCVLHTPDGFRACPVKTAADAERAADYLERHRADLPLPVRREAAERTLNKLAETRLRANARFTLERQAGRGLPDPGQVAAQFALRAKRASDQATRTALDAVRKLASTVGTDRAKLAAAADALDAYDRACGYPGGGYPDGLKPAEEVFTTWTVGELADGLGELVVCPSGRAYSRSKLAGLPVETVRAAFGEVTDWAQVAGPALDALCREHGVEPAYTAAVRAGVSADALAAWAA